MLALITFAVVLSLNYNISVSMPMSFVSHPNAFPQSPLCKVVTPRTQVPDVLSCSPSELRGDVSRKLTACLVGAQEDGILEVTTAGKPQTWVCLTKGQSPNSDASERTLCQRTSELQHVSQIVSVSSSTAQKAHEIRQLHKDEQDELLHSARLLPKGAKSGAALAMKGDLHVPWYNKLQKLRHWLRSFGLSFKSKARTCKQVAIPTSC